MNIVVLDGFALNPGDLQWSELKALGAVCTIHDRTPPAQVVERAREAEIVLVNKVVLDRGVLAQLPKLRYIGVLATGYDNIDVAAARERGIMVTHVPDYATWSVAQLTFALLLELTHHAGEHGRGVRDGRWTRNPDFAYWQHPLIELAGKILGIVGFGRIGATVAEIGSALGMGIIVHTRRRPRATAIPMEFVELDALFRHSDVVTLHCPLTPETRQLVNAERLSRMKLSAYLINTARGGLIDEPALADALNTGRIAGAGLDVLSVEPPPGDHPLLHARHCVITPHFGWATTAARTRLLHEAVENVRAYLHHRARNVVA